MTALQNMAVKPFRRCLILLFCSMLLSSLAPGEAAAQGRDDPWLPVTILYLSDVKGLIEPCG